MARTRRAVLGMVAASALAGCLDGTGDGTSPTDSPTGSPSPTASPTSDDGMGSESVQVAQHDELGEILVDSEGMTLYMFDSDTEGEGASTCYDSCADAWPPLTVDGSPSAGDDVAASLDTFERDDGSMQVTAAGWPLYYFANDGAAGDANGQGLNGVWWALRPDGTPVRESMSTDTDSPTASMAATVQVRSDPDLGDILVDDAGMTLYMFDNDTQDAGESACSGGCADNWPPLTVEGDAGAGGSVTAELTTFERGDGSTQVAANGWPLYYYAGDGSAGDTSGQGVGDVWWVLSPDGSPQREGSGGGY